MSTSAFHTKAAKDRTEVVEHARATSAGAGHALELIDQVLAGGGWKADLVRWAGERS